MNQRAYIYGTVCAYMCAKYLILMSANAMPAVVATATAVDIPRHESLKARIITTAVTSYMDLARGYRKRFDTVTDTYSAIDTCTGTADYR